MSVIGEITSIKNKINSELSSIKPARLEELAEALSEWIYKYDISEDDEKTNEESYTDLMDAASTLGSCLEDLASCCEETLEALKHLKASLDR